MEVESVCLIHSPLSHSPLSYNIIHILFGGISILGTLIVVLESLLLNVLLWNTLVL